MALLEGNGIVRWESITYRLPAGLSPVPQKEQIGGGPDPVYYNNGLVTLFPLLIQCRHLVSSVLP